MNILEIMIGLPASGKSTYAKSMIRKEATVLSSDDIRAELGIKDYTDKSNKLVFNELHTRLYNLLDNVNNLHIIYDATNLSKKRLSTISQIRDRYKNNIYIIYHFFAVEIDECVRRDSLRKNSVGKEIILRMAKSYTGFFNDLRLGLFDILVIHPDSIYLSELNKTRNFKQDNYYHTQTLSNHIKQVSSFFPPSVNKKLYIASLYHDLGKLYTKSFTDRKGRKTKNAHYYNHEKVSSYIYAIREYPRVINREMDKYNKFIILYIQAIIEKHMGALETKNNKVLDSFFKKQYNLNFIDDLKKFQYADKYRTKIQKLIIWFKSKYCAD